MSRAIKIGCHPLHALRWRALSTSTHDQSVSPPTPLIPRSGGRELETRDFHPRMIFVRPWDGIPTMAHAFAIVREIEKQFGKVQEFVVTRDPELHSSCSPFLHATFSSDEDANAIPLDGKVIQVVAPEVDRQRDGGIGLDDLHVYLNPETREQALLERDSAREKEREWGPPEGKVIDVKLERTASRYPPPVLDRVLNFGRRGPPHLNNPIRTHELAHAIHAFGGFVVNPPSHTESGQTLMEATVARWSRMVKQPSRPPRPPQVSAQENSLHTNPSEHPENATQLPQGSVTPEEVEIEWTSFATPNVAPSSSPESTPTTPDTATSIPSSLPAAPSPIQPSSPSSPSSWSKPTLEAVDNDLRLNPEPKTKRNPNPTSESNVIKTEPKISRRLRLLNAARLAGATVVEKPPNPIHDVPFGAGLQATSRVPDSGASQTSTELGDDQKGSEEKNKVAARRWWNFLTGGN